MDLSPMTAALSIEASTIRKKGGGRKVDLRAGQQSGEANGSYLYRFVIDDEISFRDETPIRMSVGQDEVPGQIVSCGEGILVISLEKDVGPTISAARLSANDAFLLELLREKLIKVQKQEVDFNFPSANRVFGEERILSADTEPDQAVLVGGDMNNDQMTAVRRSLGSETTFIWGPPGTGKTFALARIVEAHYRAGRTVLLVSNTNIAVDTALERVAERLKGEPDFHQGLVIRRGPVVKEELRRRYGPQVIFEEVVKRLTRPMIEKRNSFLLQRQRVEEMKATLGEQRNLHFQKDHLKEKICEAFREFLHG